MIKMNWALKPMQRVLSTSGLIRPSGTSMKKSKRSLPGNPTILDPVSYSESEPDYIYGFRNELFRGTISMIVPKKKKYCCSVLQLS